MSRDGDIEKCVTNISHPDSPSELSTGAHKVDVTLDVDEAVVINNKFFLQLKSFERVLGVEARGIHRVKSNEQTGENTLSFLQTVILWFSINTAAQNMTLASLGQSVYGLGFVDATCCSLFGAVLGIFPVAYIAGWGPWSGNRTMVCLPSLLRSAVSSA